MTTAIHDGLRFTAISLGIKSTIVRPTLLGLQPPPPWRCCRSWRRVVKGGPIDTGS
nr:hypothetical protein [Ensifer sp. IC4062]